MLKKNSIIALLGATGLGKSSIAIELAKKINAEIISCDSMQIYKDLNIGTGKVSENDMQGIKHYLLSQFKLSQEYNANIFCQLAENAVKSIHSKDKTAILVGGSGMYARLFLYQDEQLPANKTLYKKLWNEYQEKGIAPLWEKFYKKEPLIAQQVKKNPRRIIRLLEASQLSNSPLPIQEFANSLRKNSYEFILVSSPEFNREKIKSRCYQMIKKGWIRETQELSKKGLFQSPTASQAIGYKIIDTMLKSTQFSKSLLLEKLVSTTHRYAKKQRTWFKHKHPNAKKIFVEKQNTHSIINEILKIINDLEMQQSTKKYKK